MAIPLLSDARICERSAGLAWQSIQHEIGRRAVRLEARVQALFVIDHRGYFSSRSGFRRVVVQRPLLVLC